MDTPKTINDCTLEDMRNLALSAVNLLAAAMLQYWEHNGDQSKDRSYFEAIEDMRRTLDGIGIPTATVVDFKANFESILASGLEPTAWAKLHGADG